MKSLEKPNEAFQDTVPKDNISILQQNAVLASDGTSMSRRSPRKVMLVLQKELTPLIFGARLDS